MERLVLMPGQPRPPGVPRRIRCQFNPGELVQAREAGLAQRPASLATLASHDSRYGLQRPALRFTGQGRDTLTLQLLFETGGTGQPRGDVRELTAPLFRLAEPAAGHGEAPCPVDLFWGKSWSFRGAIARVAERLDRFTPLGLATRAWISLEVEALAPRQSRPALAGLFG